MAEYKITVDFKDSGGGGSKKEKGYQSVFSEWADDIGENPLKKNSSAKISSILMLAITRQKLSSY